MNMPTPSPFLSPPPPPPSPPVFGWGLCFAYFFFPPLFIFSLAFFGGLPAFPHVCCQFFSSLPCAFSVGVFLRYWHCAWPFSLNLVVVSPVLLLCSSCCRVPAFLGLFALCSIGCTPLLPLSAFLSSLGIYYCSFSCSFSPWVDSSRWFLVRLYFCVSERRLVSLAVFALPDVFLSLFSLTPISLGPTLALCRRFLCWRLARCPRSHFGFSRPSPSLSRRHAFSHWFVFVFPLVASLCRVSFALFFVLCSLHFASFLCLLPCDRPPYWALPSLGLPNSGFPSQLCLPLHGPMPVWFCRLPAFSLCVQYFLLGSARGHLVLYLIITATPADLSFLGFGTGSCVFCPLLMSVVLFLSTPFVVLLVAPFPLPRHRSSCPSSLFYPSGFCCFNFFRVSSRLPLPPLSRLIPL